MDPNHSGVNTLLEAARHSDDENQQQAPVATNSADTVQQQPSSPTLSYSPLYPTWAERQQIINQYEKLGTWKHTVAMAFAHRFGEKRLASAWKQTTSVPSWS